MTVRKTLIDKWIDDNEHFLGEKLNKEKKKHYDLMIKLCREIQKIDKRIVFDDIPFTEHSRNSIAVLIMPEVHFISNSAVKKHLAALIYEADDFCTSTLGGQLRLSFGIRDMWDEWGYTNDMEHGDQYYGNLKIIK